MNTYSYWYPFSDYRKVGIHKYVLTNDFPLQNYWGTKIKSSYSFIPELREFYDEIFMEMLFEDNILLKIMFSFGRNFWIIFTCLLIIVYKKSYRHLIPFVYIAALFFTVLLGPLAVLRYIYQDFLILPLLFTCAFQKIARKEQENKF